LKGAIITQRKYEC